MPDLLQMTVRFRLREALEQWGDGEGMSQSELSRRSGVSFTTINRMSANLTAQVSLKTLDAIAAVLGIKPGELIEGEKGRGRKRG